MNPTGTDWLRVVREGLPATTGKRQRVVVVGAGIAGLVAAYELLRAGHDPLILESQHRVGGRILTLREPFAPGLYGEAGAMRIPRTHALTLAYADKFGLKLNPFTLQNPEAYCHLFGRKHRWREIDADPSLLAGEASGQDRGTTCGKRWEDAIRPLLQRRLRDRDRAVSGAPPCRGHASVLAREAPRDPAAPLRCLGEDLPPVPAPFLGGGRRHHRGRHGHRPADPQRVLSGTRTRARPRRDAGELHVVGRRAALGIESGLSAAAGINARAA